jgi:hypothetical protein
MGNKLRQIPKEDLRRVRAAVRKPAIQRPKQIPSAKHRQIPKKVIR